MDNILMKLENTLTKKFININIHNYSHENFKELSQLIEELANKLFVTYSYTVVNASINNEYIHIVFKDISHQLTLDNTLSIQLHVQDFIISDIEVSLLN